MVLLLKLLAKVLLLDSDKAKVQASFRRVDPGCLRLPFSLVIRIQAATTTNRISWFTFL